MTFRPARLSGLAAVGALLTASIAAPTAAFAQEQGAAPAQGQAQGPQIVPPQSWPQCIVLLEEAEGLDGAPDNAAGAAEDFRASLDILAEANDVGQDELDEAFAQIRTGLEEAEDSVIVENANTCASASPDPSMFEGAQAG